VLNIVNSNKNTAGYIYTILHVGSRFARSTKQLENIVFTCYYCYGLLKTWI